MNRSTDCDYARLEEGDSETTMSTTTRLPAHIEEPSPIMIEVEAPATLAGGYVFWAKTFQGKDKNQSITVPVRVPPGGVSAGETIRAPLLEHLFDSDNDEHDDSKTDSDQTNDYREYTTSVSSKESTKTKSGKWKYGICSCFQQGIFHRDVWNAWLCPQVLLAQILKRNDLLWLAKPENFNGQQNQNSSRMAFVLRWTFRFLFCLVTVAELYAVHLLQQLQDDDAEDVSAVTIRVFWSQELICFALSLPMSIWMLLVVVRLRRTIRERHNIPPATITVPGCRSDPLCNLTLGKSEDLACAICCSCCMLRQMASQTYDEEETESSSQKSPTNEQPIEEHQNDDSQKGFRWWFQRRTPKTLEESELKSPLIERPPSPSPSLNSSHLRHRLSSSPVSSPAEKC